MFDDIYRIPLKGLSRFWEIGSCISLRVLSGFQVSPVLVFPAHPLPVPVRRYFEFSIFCCFYISWYHWYMVPDWVVFCDIIR